MVERVQLIVEYIRSAKNIADGFTKLVKEEDYHRNKAALLGTWDDPEKEECWR